MKRTNYDTITTAVARHSRPYVCALLFDFWRLSHLCAPNTCRVCGAIRAELSCLYDIRPFTRYTIVIGINLLLTPAYVSHIPERKLFYHRSTAQHQTHQRLQAWMTKQARTKVLDPVISKHVVRHVKFPQAGHLFEYSGRMSMRSCSSVEFVLRECLRSSECHEGGKTGLSKWRKISRDELCRGIRPTASHDTNKVISPQLSPGALTHTANLD